MWSMPMQFFLAEVDVRDGQRRMSAVGVSENDARSLLIKALKQQFPYMPEEELSQSDIRIASLEIGKVYEEGRSRRKTELLVEASSG